MRMLKIAVLLALPIPAVAGCIGSGNMKTCYDDSGNSYQVNRIGKTTYVNGTNSSGQTWNSQSSTYGRTTYQTGTAADGGNWNQTIHSYGNGSTTQYGNDSNGNSFYKSCNKYGCY